MSERQPVYDAIFASPIGPIGIRSSDRHILSIELRPDPAAAVSTARPGAATAAALRWLAAYFRDPATPAVPVPPVQGSHHQLRVWAALRRIPAGRVRSYGDLARTLRSSPRAIGQACRSNPLPLLIPCHRVVGKNGLGGFMGGERAVAIKQWLLRHEGVL